MQQTADTFAVTLEAIQTPVEAGRDIRVTARIENTGETNDTQTVSVHIPGVGHTTAEVQLSGGATTQQRFTVQTDSDDAGSYTVELASETDSVTAPVTVAAANSAVYRLTEITAPAQVEADSNTNTTAPFSVGLTVTNTGSQLGTQTITVSTQRANISQVVTLGPREQTTITVRDLVGSGLVNETFTVRVDTGDETSTRTVDVVPAQSSGRDLRSIAIGEERAGELDSTDPVAAGTQGYHEPVTFSGEAGQRVTIEMSAEGGDTYLLVRGPDGTEIATDDDDGPGRNSRITGLKLPTTGTYTVIATSFRPDATFPYTLSVAEAGPSSDGYITGVVTNDKNEPLGGVTVEVIDPDTASKVATVTNSEGEYTVEVGAGETYDVRAITEAGSSRADSGVIQPNTTTAVDVVVPGASPTASIELTAEGASNTTPGEEFTRTYTLSNTGESDVADAQLNLSTPRGLSVTDVSGDGLSRGADVFFTEGVDAGASRTVTYTFAVDEEAALESKTITATGHLGAQSTQTRSTVTVTQPRVVPENPGFGDVIRIIAAYNSGEQYNGATVEFTDVLKVISAFNTR
jgi:hypothetical protein